eukprot:TRINITY_DN9640_c0_g1_i1.p1 TRINITY_DN9640_c0_g1~~TRINITY_DN9640_c0_g1_i1.p1  ORF type:complete len:136 (+),score=1.73 TRINITY_DN9640_c0_g1_i1:82-489(+)
MWGCPLIEVKSPNFSKVAIYIDNPLWSANVNLLKPQVLSVCTRLSTAIHRKHPVIAPASLSLSLSFSLSLSSISPSPLSLSLSLSLERFSSARVGNACQQGSAKPLIQGACLAFHLLVIFFSFVLAFFSFFLSHC